MKRNDFYLMTSFINLSITYTIFTLKVETNNFLNTMLTNYPFIMLVWTINIIIIIFNLISILKNK